MPEKLAYIQKDTFSVSVNTKILPNQENNHVKEFVITNLVIYQ